MTSNNLEEYEDAERYDLEYGSFEPDGPFFAKLSEPIHGNILDLACGTGRLTIPISEYKARNNIVGLDLSKSMLELARRKSKKNTNIRWVLGDFRAFKLELLFSLIIMGGNSFQALLTEEDQKKMLLCVFDHLEPGGIFSFNTRNANVENLEKDGKLEYWHSFLDSQKRGVEVFGKTTYNASSQIATYKTVRRWPDKSSETLLDLRFTSKEKLNALLKDIGFSKYEIFGDVNKEPISLSSPRFVVVCQK